MRRHDDNTFSTLCIFAAPTNVGYNNNMGSDDTTKQMHVLFAGRVQGVGFRYTTCHIAENHAVTGYVRNLPNGEVELVAEGSETVLSDFLRAIRNSQLGRYIDQDRVRWDSATGKYNQFGVSF